MIFCKNISTAVFNLNNFSGRRTVHHFAWKFQSAKFVGSYEPVHIEEDQGIHLFCVNMIRGAFETFTVKLKTVRTKI